MGIFRKTEHFSLSPYLLPVFSLSPPYLLPLYRHGESRERMESEPKDGTNIQQREDLSKLWPDFILFEQKKNVLLLGGGEAGTGVRYL